MVKDLTHIQRHSHIYKHTQTRDEQRAHYLYLNESGKRLKNPVFVFITLLILEN